MPIASAPLSADASANPRTLLLRSPSLLPAMLPGEPIITLHRVGRRRHHTVSGDAIKVLLITLEGMPPAVRIT